MTECELSGNVAHNGRDGNQLDHDALIQCGITNGTLAVYTSKQEWLVCKVHVMSW